MMPNLFSKITHDVSLPNPNPVEDIDEYGKDIDMISIKDFNSEASGSSHDSNPNFVLFRKVMKQENNMSLVTEGIRISRKCTETLPDLQVGYYQEDTEMDEMGDEITTETRFSVI
jgi:hypothetical protein